MSLGGVAGIFSAIIGVAMLSVFLSSTNTAQIIKNLFDGFSGALRASMGH